MNNINLSIKYRNNLNKNAAENEESSPPRSGNHFGWKVSFYGLLIILGTLFIDYFWGKEYTGRDKLKTPSEIVSDSIKIDENRISKVPGDGE